ncbi:MAG: copper amine oxidase N-terminal domain-containing protein [Ruminococcaceae bacterium]|nr:copper amine oxidase N-terminal domain-containing protein [Oscillospiraceae bacterium]
MKKIISLILTLALCLSLVSFVGVYAEETLLNSESFENGLGTWKLWNPSSESCVSFVDGGTDGKKALKLTDPDDQTGPGVQTQVFDVTPGAEYKAVIDYKLVSGSLYGITLRFVDSKGKGVQDKREKLKGGNTWNTLTLTDTAPANATGVIILLAGNKANVCEIHIDNAKLYTNGAATSAPVTPAEPSQPVASGDALFADSFENGMDKWAAFSKNGIEKLNIVSTEATEGKMSLHCVDDMTDGAPAIILAKYIPVTPGTLYTATSDYKLVSGNSFKVILRFFDADKKKLSDVTGIGKSNDWEKLTLSLEAPENAVNCAILVAGFSKNLGEAYVDNIVLKGAAASAPVTGESKLDKINKSSIVLFVGSANALVNGQKTLIDKTNDKVIATIVDSRTLVPVRFIAENFGAEVGWDDATRTVTLTLKDKVVKIVLDKAEIDINGSVTAIDVPAQSIEGRTMLPLRAFVENVMGKKIFWDARGLIVITDTDMLDAAQDKDTIDTIINNIK